MPRKPAIQVGEKFTDKNGETVTVVKYEKATKVLVQWDETVNGEVVAQYKSVAQLRSGDFSQRTRKTKGSEKIEGTAENWENGKLGQDENHSVLSDLKLSDLLSPPATEAERKGYKTRINDQEQ